MSVLSIFRVNAKAPKCIVCGKACDPIKDQNSDGTFAHYKCLRDTQVRPYAK